MRRRPWTAGAAIALTISSCALSTTYVSPIVETCPTSAQSVEEVEASVFLIGDGGGGGAGGRPDPVRASLAADARRAPAGSVVVFLGDNIYPSGLPEEEGDAPGPNARKLLNQIDCFRGITGLRVRFVPGNHDYVAGGFGSVLREASLAARAGMDAGVDAGVRPAAPLGEPVVVSPPEPVGSRWSLVYLDTVAWLRPERRSAKAPDPRAELDRVLREEKARGREPLVLGHHPIASHGRHGGFYSWREHLFPLHELSPLRDAGYLLPLPIVGSLYPLLRGGGCVGSVEDMANPGNRGFVESLSGALQAAPPLLYACGHEHALQVLRGPGLPWLVASGAGYLGREDSITTGRDTAFASPAAGYFRVDLLRDGRVRLEAVEIREGKDERREFATWLTPRAPAASSP
ncbi:MAG: metallophosphoesterase [Planctomycetes bacterium]|nr:metallophosphoesterase [Planctomycetota bacterium]